MMATDLVPLTEKKKKKGKKKRERERKKPKRWFVAAIR